MKKSIEKRRRILDAAAKVLAEKGYAETTLFDIAEEVGTGAGSLYYYFPSRDELVKEVVREGARIMSDMLKDGFDRMPSGTTFKDKIAAGIRVQLKQSAERHAYGRAYRRVFHQLPAEMRDELSQRELTDLWIDVLKAAQHAGEIRQDVDLRMARLFIMGAVVWVHEWYDPQGANSPEEIADHFFAMFMEGVSADAVGRSEEIVQMSPPLAPAQRQNVRARDWRRWRATSKRDR